MMCYYRARKVANRTLNADADGFDCICPPLPMALLLVNRQINEEVAAILFSKNKFRITRTARHASCVPGHTCQAQGHDDVPKQCY